MTNDDYPWYRIVDGDEDLMQGDFIKECPIIMPPLGMRVGEDFDACVSNYNVIVMSQSCDLANRKIDLVLLCPVWPLDDMEKKSEFLKNSGGKEKLRQGDYIGYHLLNKCDIEGFNVNYQVVDFRNIYSAPLDFLIDLTKKKGKRLRLLPPYREHLSQAFARFFMRVGLPIDIPPFKTKR